MRTAIFFGLLFVSDAIRKGSIDESGHPYFVAFILLIMFIMDGIDFLINIKKQHKD